jgi:hypothetical protein
MLKNKDFLMTNNKIRHCTLNESKMTVLEYMYCMIFVWKVVPKKIKGLLMDLLENGLEFIVSFVSVCLLPLSFIIFPYEAYKAIQKSKKEVYKNYCYQCKLYIHKGEKHKECKNCKLINGVATSYIQIEK